MKLKIFLVIFLTAILFLVSLFLFKEMIGLEYFVNNITKIMIGDRAIRDDIMVAIGMPIIVFSIFFILFLLRSIIKQRRVCQEKSIN